MRPLSAALAVLLLTAPVARAAPAPRASKTSATSTKRASKKTTSKSTSKSTSKFAAKATSKDSEETPEPAEEPAVQQPSEESAAKPEEKPSDTPVGQTEPKPIPGTQQEPSLNFDLLEPAPPAEVAQAVNPELEHKVHQRRTMLKLHQGLGFAMAAGLTTSVIMGQLLLNDSFRGGQDSRALLPWHTGFVIGTTTLFATVGLLGVLAPTPYPKESRWDTVRFHKLFMAAATAGMVTQFVLGLLAVNSHGQVQEVRLATAHQVVGYATLGAVAAGMIALTF